MIWIMTEEIIDREQVMYMLGMCDKTVTKMIFHEGLPMTKIGGRTYRGVASDVIAWIRSNYPQKYKDMMANAPMSTKTVKTRGQYEGEEYGIVERPDGTKYIVDGKLYIKFLRLGEVDGDVLVKKLVRGHVSFEQTTREPVA